MTQQTTRTRRTDLAAEEFVASVLAQWTAGESVRRRTPSGVRLHVDRQLPFLCLYRRPNGRLDPGTQRLVTGESAYATAPIDPLSRRDLRRLILSLGKRVAERFGAFLLVEVWSAESKEGESDEPDLTPQPHFAVYARRDRALSPTVNSLEQALKKVRILKQPATVEVIRRERWGPPGMVAPVSLARLGRRGGAAIGIEVRAIYRNGNDELFQSALDAIASAFPGRRVVAIGADALASDYGTIHCITRTIPALDGDGVSQRVRWRKGAD